MTEPDPGARPEVVRADRPGPDYQAVQAEPTDWRLPHAGDGLPRRCRGDNRCSAPVVLVLLRGGWHRRMRYFYCARHALVYGRWVEGGQVLEWRRRP